MCIPYRPNTMYQIYVYICMRYITYAFTFARARARAKAVNQMKRRQLSLKFRQMSLLLGCKCNYH